MTQDDIYFTLSEILIDSESWIEALKQADYATLRRVHEFSVHSKNRKLMDRIEQEMSAEHRQIKPAKSLPLDEEPDTQAEIVTVSPEEMAVIQATALINERVGQRKLANAITKLVTVTDFLTLQNIKESRCYRNIRVTTDDGKLVTVTTFRQYCEIVEGRSMESVNLDLLNFKSLGSDFVQSLQAIGIGPGTMRSLRHIPADERTELENAAKTANRDEFLELAEALIEKHAKEREKLTHRADSAEKQLHASRERVERLRLEKDSLEDKVNSERLKPPSVDETTASLITELGIFTQTHVKAAISAAVRSGVKQLTEHGDQHGQNHRNFIAGLLADLENEINILRHDFNIPATASRDNIPEWVKSTEWGQKLTSGDAE